jgi:ring-1,2-phenylacetyl-CoA epoxidase subunit PaaC
MSTALFSYTLHLGDNALILAQRNSEWCAHGPVLEQDIAITNISLDLLGQARNFYQHAANLYTAFSDEEKGGIDHLIPHLWKGFNRVLEEDDLAFLREESQYLNLSICELPNGDWAQTTLRQFFFSAYQLFLYESLLEMPGTGLSAIVEKSLKETTYHLRWSSEWVIRLGDGTDESNARLQKALHQLWPFTPALFTPSSYERSLAAAGFIPAIESLRDQWMEKLTTVFNEATVHLPTAKVVNDPASGKDGKHTEHLGTLLGDMQYLQRSFPNSSW